MKQLNWTLIRYIEGLLLLMEAGFIAVAACVSLYYNQTVGDTDFYALAIPAVITGVCGYLLQFSGRHYAEKFTQKEGFLIVSLSWIIFSFFGMLPFLIYGTVDTVSDAFFETISGFTTTGATVLSNINIQPHGILFWRSMTQWLGGLGIVVFSLALLPLIGTGGTQLFNAEVSGLNVDKIRPKIQSTARRLFGIYISMTLICALVYWIGPMSIYDAINHGLTTIATGGFSTHQESIGYFNSAYVEYTCSFFMFAAATNFHLFYLAGLRQWHNIWKNEEFSSYVYIVLIFTILFMILDFCTKVAFAPSAEQLNSMGNTFESVFRASLFHTTTIISSTGFQGSIFDYNLWGPLFWIPTLLIMASGGCAGSTSGGLKLSRIVLLLKNSKNEFQLQLHPRYITTVHMNGHTVPFEIVNKVLAFAFLFAIIWVVSVFILQCMGLSFDTAVGTATSALGNCGPGLGSTGPAANWADIPSIGKWYLSLIMLTGRLELFTVILLFTRTFWKK